MIQDRQAQIDQLMAEFDWPAVVRIFQKIPGMTWGVGIPDLDKIKAEASERLNQLFDKAEAEPDSPHSVFENNLMAEWSPGFKLATLFFIPRWRAYDAPGDSTVLADSGEADTVETEAPDAVVDGEPVSRTPAEEGD